MNNTYFPHYAGGKNNKKTSYPATYNFSPDLPITLDPRQIITAWTEEALLTLTNSEVYAGMQIYSLDDKSYRICRWIPTIGSNGKFSANDCLWDILHTEDDFADWVNIRTEEWYEEDIDDLIIDETYKSWRLDINSKSNGGYAGFYEFPDVSKIEEFLDTESNLHKVFYRATKNPDAYKVSWVYDQLYGNQTIDLSKDTQKTSANCNLVIIIPKLGESTVTNISIDGMTATFLIINKTLDVINGTQSMYNMVETDFTIYVVENIITFGGSSPKINVTFAAS